MMILKRRKKKLDFFKREGDDGGHFLSKRMGKRRQLKGRGGLKMKAFEDISLQVFDDFKGRRAPILQKKVENPREYGVVEYPDFQGLVGQIRDSFESILGRISFTGGGLVIPDEGSARIYFSFEEEAFSPTRPQFMEFLCKQIKTGLGLGDDSQEMYLVQYIFRHICWELMWKLNRLLQGDLNRAETIRVWKNENAGFIDQNFPAETLNLFLEGKKGKKKRA